MVQEMKAGCAHPTGVPVGEEAKETKQTESLKAGGEVKSMITVGKKAPDFTAPAYYRGKFVSVQLAEYLGKWVILCFYPGDFTFV